MELQQKGIWILCAVILSFCLIALFKSGHPLRAALLSVLSGGAGLCALWLLRRLCDVGLPLNEMTIGVSAVAGVPGVILLLITQLILH